MCGGSRGDGRDGIDGAVVERGRDRSANDGSTRRSRNDLLPENNDVSNCVGTVESANCGSKARADGHTYLVFLALTLGLAFIGWRIARGVKARDAAHEPSP